jgi:hypothetical protein
MRLAGLGAEIVRHRSAYPKAAERLAQKKTRAAGHHLKNNQSGERAKKGHAGMRPRMALLYAGFTVDDQS